MDTIFASQLCDLLTVINPLADLVSDYRACPEIPGHPIKLHFVNNMNGVSRLYCKWVTANSCLENIILFSILGILYTNIIFSTDLE